MIKKPVSNTIIVNQPAKKSILKSLFTGADGKLSSVTLGFIIWIIGVTVCWTSQSIYDHKLSELPTTVVELTLALGATKVTHRIAEGNWEKVISQILGLFNKKKLPVKSKKK